VKTVVWSRPARLDANDAAYWYATQGGLELGEGFLAEVEAALEHIGRHPQLGSTRYAVQLKFDELRTWPLRRFPYLVFYVEREAQVDVWRILHAQRDIPAWMTPDDSSSDKDDRA
jgi:toxin ParE1/3/4